MSHGQTLDNSKGKCVKLGESSMDGWGWQAEPVHQQQEPSWKTQAVLDAIRDGLIKAADQK